MHAVMLQMYFWVHWSSFGPYPGWTSPKCPKNTLLAKSSVVNGLRLWCVMFLRFFRNQTYIIFYSRTFPLPYIVGSEIGISFAITDLVRTNFMLNRFWYFCFIVSMEISITLKNTFNQTSSFFKNWCHFHINQIKWRLVKRQLKILGMVQNIRYRTTFRFVLLRFCLTSLQNRAFKSLALILRQPTASLSGKSCMCNNICVCAMNIKFDFYQILQK